MRLSAGEIARKAVHMAGVLVIPLLQQLGPAKTAALFFSLSAALYLYPSFAEKSEKTVLAGFTKGFRNALDFLERKDHKRYRGAMYFFASIGAISLIFPIQAVSVALIVLCIGDGVSALVGRSLGKNRLFHNRSKSWEGSLSGFVASGVVCTAITNIPMAIFAAFVGMLVESVDTKINDNLSVPFTVSILSSLTVYLGLLTF
ncbi:MAG: hypothetical protein HY051_06015 [Candidatus Aenigmarchaeota archaeon]|nr:hypothetical protein [Candidatus Aenigmarchaeota archaeon]